MRILAQSAGKLVAELLRIISDLENFLAQGHGCHSLNTLALSVGFEHCSALSHYVTMLPCCDSLTQFVVCVCGGVTLGLHNTGETLLPLLATGCHCVHLPTGVPRRGVLLLWSLPTGS